MNEYDIETQQKHFEEDTCQHLKEIRSIEWDCFFEGVRELGTEEIECELHKLERELVRMKVKISIYKSELKEREIGEKEHEEQFRNRTNVNNAVL